MIAVICVNQLLHVEDFTKYDDAMLLGLLKGGDGRAFDEIYRRYWPVLLRHAFRMLREKEACRDVLQDAFVAFWNNVPQLDVQVTLSAYLYGMVRNGVLRALARDQVRLNYLGQLHSEERNARDLTDETVLAHELQQCIDGVIAGMPERMREVYLLRRDEALSHQQIADKLGIGIPTVKYHLQEATKRLREAFGAE